jgi:hypothetical protein
MDETSNLKLPYILAAQSQKHVTHNEALRALDAIVQLAVQDKDLSAPPGSPVEGDRYIIGASPSGAWAGHATHVAAWQDGAWAFYVPVAGWLAWVDDESQSYLFSGGGWISAPGGGGASLVPKGAWSSVATYSTGDLVEHEGYAFLSNIDANVDNEPDAATPGSTSEWTYFSVVTGGGGGGGEGSVNPVSLVGVNVTADATNRLSVVSPASLFSHEGAGHQLKINKDTAADTASVLFQTAFSGRAEFGLAGDDDFHVKVSADGSAWHEALVVSRSSGAVRGKLACPIAPGGRLTLASGVPVMTSDVAGATTVYYTPYIHQCVPLYDGASFVMTDIGGQLSQATTDTTKSPAAVTTNTNYDLFVWNDSGTFRCTRGPAWSSGTARGTGSGTTELERVQGILVNKQAITNGPAARRGTYVGTIRSNGSSQIDWIFGDVSAGGTAGVLNVWNCYNRADIATRVADSTDLWTYATAAWRAANNSSTYRVSFVLGLDDVQVSAQHCGFVQRAGSNVNAMVGVGLDTTTAFSGSAVGALSNVTGAVGANAQYAGYPGIGAHFISAIEYTNGATATYYGDGAAAYIQSALFVQFKG